MPEIGAKPDLSEIKVERFELDEFKNIMPEDGMNFDEAQNFWDNFFEFELNAEASDKVFNKAKESNPSSSETEDSQNNLDESIQYLDGSNVAVAEPEETQNPHTEIVDGKTNYYDDNGKLYRVENDLVPNTEYEINGYKYTTDDKGRIIFAEGTLHMKEREGRLQIKDSIEDIGKGDQKEGDDRGHLIGDQFDGSNGLENMIPQDADINEKDFRYFENDLAKEVKDGKEVTVKVEPIYEGESRRPDVIVVTYSIDGEESVRIFPNNKEG
jgi:hypothetical protein